MLGLEQEDGHLVALNGIGRAVDVDAAAAGDALRRELFDPVPEAGPGVQVTSSKTPVQGGGT